MRQHDFDKSELETVISPKASIIDNLLSAFLMLLNQGTILSLDTTFVTKVHLSIRLKCMIFFDTFNTKFERKT